MGGTEWKVTMGGDFLFVEATSYQRASKRVLRRGYSWGLILLFVQAPDICKEEKTADTQKRTPERNDQKGAAQHPEKTNKLKKTGERPSSTADVSAGTTARWVKGRGQGDQWNCSVLCWAGLRVQLCWPLWACVFLP
ncbi:hypothetical protein PAMP_014351 [Pampus punctatissimus]